MAVFIATNSARLARDAARAQGIVAPIAVPVAGGYAVMGAAVTPGYDARQFARVEAQRDGVQPVNVRELIAAEG